MKKRFQRYKTIMPKTYLISLIGPLVWKMLRMTMNLFQEDVYIPVVKLQPAETDGVLHIRCE